MAESWARFEGLIRQRLEAIELAADAVSRGELTEDLRQTAAAEAHKLAGSLGTFGLDAGSKVARVLEEILHSEVARAEESELTELADRLRRLIEAGPGSGPSKPATFREWPVLLVLLEDRELATAVAEGAQSLGLRGEVVADTGDALEWLESRRPALSVVDLDSEAKGADDTNVLETLMTRHPESPVLVLSESVEMVDRVRLSRSGNCSFLGKPVVASEIIDGVGDLLVRGPEEAETVLAVDEDPEMLAALRHHLGDRFNLVTVEDPRDLFDVLEETAPTVVMLNVDMAGVSGIELCRVIRADQRWRSLPILFLTSDRDPETIRTFFEAGADDYVNKPIVGPELLTRLSNRVERAQLFRRLADTDNLTGASMRGQSVRVLGRYIRLGRRHARPVSLAILDVDHFKTVNDRYGHTVGDRVLGRIGRLLLGRFRAEDLVSRWGGEEFLVGMYGTGREDGAARLRAILGEIRETVFRDDEGNAFSVTVSGGVAEYPGDESTLDGLIRVADDALYRAKEDGRDRVILAGE